MPTKERTPAKVRESQRRSIITKWHKSGSKASLKAWARAVTDDMTKLQVSDWFHNKRANTSNPPKGIGRTRTRVKSGGNKGQQPKKLDGK